VECAGGFGGVDVGVGARRYAESAEGDAEDAERGFGLEEDSEDGDPSPRPSPPRGEGGREGRPLAAAHCVGAELSPKGRGRGAGRRVVACLGEQAGFDGALVGVGVVFGLESDEFGVAAVGGHEFVVGADFADAAVFENDDAVGVADGAESVGDDECCSALHELCEASLDESFAFGVEVAGGFVEDEDGGVGEDGAGDGDALFLSAGEADAALADEGVVSEVEFGDEAVGVGGLGGVFDVALGGVALGVGDVLGDGAVEEEDILFDDAEESAVGPWVDVAEVVSVEADGALGGVVEASDEVAEGGFAGAAGPDECDGFACGDVDADVVEAGFGLGVCGGAVAGVGSGVVARAEACVGAGASVAREAWGGVGEGDVVEGDAALGGVSVDVDGGLVVGELFGFVEQVDDAVEAGELVLDAGGAGDEGLEGSEEPSEVEEEGDEFAGGAFALEDAAAEVEEDGDGCEWYEELPDDFERA